MSDRSMWQGGDYDYLMGRWSLMMAPMLVRFAGIQDKEKVLDVGCGTGSLLRAVLDAGPATEVTGIDGSEEYIGIVRQNIQSDRANFECGDAQFLPWADNSFDCCVSLLVMNFIPDPGKAVSEMKRVTRPGGTVAAAVWDYGDGMEMLRHLWDEACEIDADAVARHEGNMPLCRNGELAALWNRNGLSQVDETDLTIQLEFKSFDDYWAPFVTGVGPSGSYVRALEPRLRDMLRQRLCLKLCEGDSQAPIRMPARAWAVRGQA